MSKPSYRAPKWALMVRLMQKGRLKSLQESLIVENQAFEVIWAILAKTTAAIWVIFATHHPHVVQEQHRVVSPCEFKYRKFWYSVPRMLPLFRSLTLFLASSGSRWPRRGQRPTRLCGSFSGQTKPGSQSLTHTHGCTPNQLSEK